MHPWGYLHVSQDQGMTRQTHQTTLSTPPPPRGDSTPPPPCISYANVRNYYGPYAHCSLDKGVAYTRGGDSINQSLSNGQLLYPIVRHLS